MQQFIEDLYNGNISPFEQLKPLIDGYKEKLEKATDLEDSFVKKLSPELKAEFEKVMHYRMTATSMETAQAFVEGFKIGGNLVVEILSH